jgi:hypothetical protein
MTSESDWEPVEVEQFQRGDKISTESGLRGGLLSSH